MTFDNRYSSTVPAPLDGMPAAAPAPESAAEVRRAEFQAAGAVGNELNAVLVRMRQSLDALRQSHPDAGAHTAALLRDIEDASRIARQSRFGESDAIALSAEVDSTWWNQNREKYTSHVGKE